MTTRDDLIGDDLQDTQEVAGAEDSREAWLEMALVDPDSGAAALATAARRGRPLPPRSE